MSGERAAAEVCRIADLPEGRIVAVTAGKRRAAAVRQGDEVVVFSATCPHRGGPLVQGRVDHPVVADTPGGVAVDCGRLTVTCPWHGWEFDLDGGRALGDPRVGLQLIPVEVRDGRVLLSGGAL